MFISILYLILPEVHGVKNLNFFFSKLHLETMHKTTYTVGTGKVIWYYDIRLLPQVTTFTYMLHEND